MKVPDEMINSAPTIPHDADHQFFTNPITTIKDDWILQNWVKHFKGRRIPFDLVESPPGVWQIYKHRRVNLIQFESQTTWRWCCDEGGKS